MVLSNTVTSLPCKSGVDKHVEADMCLEVPYRLRSELLSVLIVAAFNVPVFSEIVSTYQY